MSGSPGCNIDRTFTYQFYLQKSVKKSSPHKKTYRNPIYLAKEYKEMIDTGKAKNQAELARIKGISRARITQIINLLKLPDNILKTMVNLGDPLSNRIISERYLRQIGKEYKKFEKIYIKNYK